MTYTKTNWQTGDVITSEKLNKMEDGIAESGGEVLVVNNTKGENNANVLDKTWQEIYDAAISNKLVFVKNAYTDSIGGGYYCELNLVRSADYEPEENKPFRIVVDLKGVGARAYSAPTPYDYPSLGGSGGVQ